MKMNTADKTPVVISDEPIREKGGETHVGGTKR